MKNPHITECVLLTSLCHPVRTGWLTHTAVAGSATADGQVRILIQVHQFRQSVNDGWITNPLQVPTLPPAGATADFGRTRARSDLVSSMTSECEGGWVTRSLAPHKRGRC